MKDPTTITPLRHEDLPVLVSWWQIGVPFVEPPSQTWLDYVLGTDHVHVFCLRRLDEQQQLLAYAQFDIDEGDAWLAVVTNPHEIRQGFARRLITESATRLRRLGVQRIVAAIEMNNQLSIRFFERAGFEMMPNDSASGQVQGFVYLALSLDSMGNTT